MNPPSSSRRKAGLCMAYGTVPTRSLADRIAREAVTVGAAACVHRLPRIRSVYPWKGRIESAVEYPLLFKLRADQWKRLSEIFVKNHPYECPGLVRCPIEGGLAPFLEWIRASNSRTPDSRTRTR
ncbi:MAG: divalent-cation tolerance protein CutA [Kiritimatiellae bacterium]|nr:divalent-cation tolerance protein CutA [Kiritimatiellia bacterium]